MGGDLSAEKSGDFSIHCSSLRLTQQSNSDKLVYPKSPDSILDEHELGGNSKKDHLKNHPSQITSDMTGPQSGGSMDQNTISSGTNKDPSGAND